MTQVRKKDLVSDGHTSDERVSDLNVNININEVGEDPIDDDYDYDELVKIEELKRTKEEPKVRFKIGYMPEAKREVLKKDLLSKDDILTIKIIAPNSNASKIGIDDSLYSIQSFDVNEEVELVGRGMLRRKNSVTDLKYFAVKSYPIDSIAKEKEDGEEYLRVNGDIKIKRTGSSEPKEIDRIFFTDRDSALAVAALATEVELDKAKAIRKEAEKVEKFLYEQLENERF